MKYVFCAEPFAVNVPDPAYVAEVAAAVAAGISYALIDFEALVHDGDVRRALRRIPQQDREELAIYRGWMLRPAVYAELFRALQARGLMLISDPAAYQHAHCLPGWYPLIAPHTPLTVHLPVGPSFTSADVLPLLAPFGDGPVIVKDYVKSRKFEWAEACFIPCASDHAVVQRVVERFLALQGDDLNEGLVFREFVQLQPLAQHEQHGMPLTQEFRLWFVDGERVYTSPYWDTGVYSIPAPPADLFGDVARTIRSRFFTMDVAQRVDGTWIIVELGDGQVAGRVDTMDVAAWVAAVYRRLEVPHVPAA